jgi:uncharacterized protein (TIGR02996 family)
MTKIFDRTGQPDATEFLLRKLSAFDLSQLDRLTFAASLSSTALSFRLKKPIRNDDGETFKSRYQVTASLRKDAASDGDISIPLMNQQTPPFATAIRAILNTRAEKLVFAAAGGCYLYLRRTGQLPGMATNWMARRYALGWLSEFTGGTPFAAALAADGTPATPPSVSFTCFGVAIPSIFVKPAKRGDARGPAFFNYAGAEQDPRTSFASPDLGAARSAIAAAVRRTFHDCDLNIIDEICHAGDPSIAWLVLADWLEERDDDRGRWIRSHRLDLAQQWNGRQEVVEFLLSASVGSTN